MPRAPLVSLPAEAAGRRGRSQGCQQTARGVTSPREGHGTGQHCVHLCLARPAAPSIPCSLLRSSQTALTATELRRTRAPAVPGAKASAGPTPQVSGHRGSDRRCQLQVLFSQKRCGVSNLGFKLQSLPTLCFLKPQVVLKSAGLNIIVICCFLH